MHYILEWILCLFGIMLGFMWLLMIFYAPYRMVRVFFVADEGFWSFVWWAFVTWLVWHA